MELRDKWIKEGTSARFKGDRSAATGERASSGPSLERRSHWAARISHTSILASNRLFIGANSKAELGFVSGSCARIVAYFGRCFLARAAQNLRSAPGLGVRGLKRKTSRTLSENLAKEKTFAAQALRHPAVDGSRGTVQAPRLHRCVAKLPLAKAWCRRVKEAGCLSSLAAVTPCVISETSMP